MPNPLVHLALVASLALPFGGAAHRKTEEGNRRYLEGLYEEALRAYTEAQVAEPGAAELYYDIGNVLYRQGDYEGASEAYTQALLHAPEKLESQAAFNLGNARFMQQDFAEALKAYRRSLELEPSDRDAKRNLELTLRALERQQEQKPDGDSGESEDEQQDKEDSGEEGDDEDQPQDSEDPEQSGADDQGQPQPGSDQARPERMTPEEAARLLDGLSEEEQENLRQEMLRRLAGTGKAREKDW